MVKLLLQLALVGVVLAACDGGGTTAPLPTPPPAVTLTRVPTALPEPTLTPLLLPTSLVTPGPAPTGNSRFAVITEADWQSGPESAPANIIIYSDFQCENCATLAPMLTLLREEYPDDFRLVYRHYPLAQHDKAILAATAAEAAGAQGRFWEMHDLLFARQAAWS